jgi:hypothetical protein
VIRFLVDKGLLPPERARMLRGWVHSGVNVHRGRRVSPASARTCNGSPNTSSATPFRSKRLYRRDHPHIPDKSFHLVRYYGWYSNKMRGRRAKQADEEVQTEGDAVELIDVSAHEPRRIPSKKWS